ncbi:sialidase family protein [Sunxiuqinia sp. A32]|uniref:sialidase family protein n=1 Tax=Sunxiuqinia sp. A32 TaxID=3461496 RepID=UPI00404611FE
MRMNMMSAITFLFTCFISLTACNKESETIIEKEVPAITENIDGIRISWDYSSMAKIAPAAGKPAGYYGYARMVQLHDNRLACVYEATPGNTEIVFSDDLGISWTLPQVVFETKNNISMAVPEITELSDNSILVACNPRPREPYTEDRLFGIKVRKSIDGGVSWSSEQTVYQAKSTFEDGCWEPSFVQLPSGEVQLFFANEGEYTSSNEQNISMLRSTDFGESWSEQPVTVGFRQGRRDGMPVPLLLPEKGELLVAVEDNKVGEFKPTIYREKIADNWNDGTISGTDSRRTYHPLAEPFSNETYAGAPYLARLESGEVLLSYQANWNRDSRWNLSAMMVEIGDDSGTLFSNRSVPFNIPITKSGLWNSIAVIDGNTPVAVTSTNAYSNNSTEVWMIKGDVIPELSVPNGTAVVDGQLTDDCWQTEWPYFVGHKSEINMSASLVKDASYLYVCAVIENAPSGFENNGQLTFQLDTERKGYEKPHNGIFAFECGFDGTIIMLEGSYGEWEEQAASAEIKYQVKKVNNLHQLELAIPLQMLSVKTNMGVNFNLKFQTNLGSVLSESLSTNDSEKPYTWSPLKFN